MSRRLVARRTGQVVAGLIIGAAIAEGAFWIRDRGAFPHVNFYVSDARLGVRLRPGATERISFGGNPVTRVRINRDGTRGGDLPAPGGNEILLVGDSQTFGLGVEEGEAFATRLGQLTGRPIVNGGVPTYGPDEYDAVVEEMLARRHPKTVVYVVNMANDLFEANRPNRDRHVVWDGWAVRKDDAAAIPQRSFPGRGLLYGQSHLVFALRKLWFERHSAEEVGPLKLGAERGFASEGNWTDLIGAGKSAGSARAQALAARHDEIRKAETERTAAAQATLDLEYKLEGESYAAGAQVDFPKQLDDSIGGQEQPLLQAARSTVGDIVHVDEGESARAVAVTAEMIKLGAEYRRDLEKALKKVKEADKRERATDALGMLKDWDKQVATLRKLDAAPAQLLRHSSPLLPHIEKVKALCQASGARLVLLVLPLDVMVSDTEWAKYGAKPQDMSATAVLVDDLTRATEEIGVSALDATAVLTAAEPGAFLNRDLHMTPKGHDAVARALAAKLAESPPTFPTGALPAGRSRFRDAYFESRGIGGIHTVGCAATGAAEWLRIYCFNGRKSPARPLGIKVINGGHGDAMTFTMPRAMLFMAPYKPGDKLAVDFAWSDRVQRLEETENGLRFRAGRPPTADDRTGATPLETKLLACLKKTKQMDDAGYKLMLGAEPDCERTYGDDCERLVECAQGDPASPPDCPRGSVNAGVLGRCHALCGPGRPACAHGACVDWPGTQICE